MKRGRHKFKGEEKQSSNKGERQKKPGLFGIWPMKTTGTCSPRANQTPRVRARGGQKNGALGSVFNPKKFEKNPKKSRKIK